MSMMLRCFDRQQNDRGNPVAAFDVDLSNDAIGDLGSPLGSANLVAIDIEFHFDSIGGVLRARSFQ